MAEKSADRRDQILQALAQMLENPAGEKVTTAALASRLGVSEAALYRHFKGKALVRAFILLPFIIPTVLSTFAWKWMFDPTFSVINWTLFQLGLITTRINWLGDPDLAMTSIIIVNIWRGVPFFAISLLAGLQTISPELQEAAAIDGARPWQRFWHVTFPHLRGVSTVTILLLAVANFNSFIIPWIMTGGGPSNASHIWITHIYELAFGRQRWGVASAYSVLLFLILMTLGYFYVRALSGSERKVTRA